jgi:hypothetical protein
MKFSKWEDQCLEADLLVLLDDLLDNLVQLEGEV